MTAQNFGAVPAPDLLGRGAEMTDVKIVIRDHDSIIRVLKCGQREIGNFGLRASRAHASKALIPKEATPCLRKG